MLAGRSRFAWDERALLGEVRNAGNDVREEELGEVFHVVVSQLLRARDTVPDRDAFPAAGCGRVLPVVKSVTLILPLGLSSIPIIGGLADGTSKPRARRDEDPSAPSPLRVVDSSLTERDGAPKFVTHMF
jgi:hypothetical protein